MVFTQSMSYCILTAILLCIISLTAHSDILTIRSHSLSSKISTLIFIADKRIFISLLALTETSTTVSTLTRPISSCYRTTFTHPISECILHCHLFAIIALICFSYIISVRSDSSPSPFTIITLVYLPLIITSFLCIGHTRTTISY